MAQLIRPRIQECQIALGLKFAFLPLVGLVQLSCEPCGRGKRRVLCRVARTMSVEEMYTVNYATGWRFGPTGDTK